MRRVGDEVLTGHPPSSEFSPSSVEPAIRTMLQPETGVEWWRSGERWGVRHPSAFLVLGAPRAPRSLYRHKLPGHY